MGESGDDDEDDDEEVDDGGDVVESGRAFCGEHGHDADGHNDRHRDGVQMAVVLRQSRGVDPKLVRHVVAQRRKIRRPRPSHRRVSDYVFQYYVPRRDERHEVPEFNPQVRK